MSKYYSRKELYNDIELSNVYIVKDLFLYKLRMFEIRLCIYLTSKKSNLDSISYKEKLWLCSGRYEDVSKLKEAESKLISLHLINPNGTGYTVREKTFCSLESGVFNKTSTQKELFIKCLPFWFCGGKFVSIKKEIIHSMLGKTRKDINKTLKRFKDKLGIDIILKERKNDFLYITDEAKELSEKGEITIDEIEVVEDDSSEINLEKENSNDSIVEPLGMRLERFVDNKYGDNKGGMFL